ncbi:acyltransferase [Mediterraneibacter glycyrrhizinilyticus]|uniref:acyltransferase n=1 Tax=Mediterraneibacter glycyrrhizinilyticus TaxID=342942 RepID=UPI0025A4724F|nr:acyltransferase [Mediterraneibacter glycyrrhizinilyticus]MDM8210262.1 acyltransferase [Mediterraneibacter glycyrrhizinilyticus]
MVKTAEVSSADKENIVEHKRYIYGFSYIRSIACVAVVVLHTVYSAVLLFGNDITTRINIISMAVVNCMMWAVPCFVMVTGALLLQTERKISYRKLFGKYILRIFATLVIFGMVFRIFDIIMDKEPINLTAFLKGIYEIFTGTSWSHIWYLYLLIGLYLLLPFYKKITDNSSEKEIRYLLAVYIIFLSILPVLGIWGISCGFYIHVSTIYPFYLFGGYAVYKHIWHPGKAISLIMFVAGTLLIIGCTVVRWQYDIPAMEILWGYSSFFAIMQAVGFFALMENVKSTSFHVINWILLKLDKCSFGIYLIHMIFVRLILRYMEFNPYKNGGILAFVLLITGILIISFVITWILQRIPLLKKVI